MFFLDTEYSRMSQDLRTPSWGTSNYAFFHAESGSGLDFSPNLASGLCKVIEKGPSRPFFESNCFFCFEVVSCCMTAEIVRQNSIKLKLSENRIFNA